MSEPLQVRAEIIKLARLLEVDPAELAYLEHVCSEDLRAFRESATDRLFDQGAKMLGRIGAASRLVPAAISATIAQRAFGPLLCARAAGAVEPARAIAVAQRLPTDFLADVVEHLDPRRVAAIIALAPEDIAAAVATELGRRGEHVVMGRFLAFVPDHLIVTAMGALSDEAMLHTAFVLEHKDRLDHAVGLLPPDRLPGVLESAARLRLWPEVLDLLDQLSDERLGPIADLVATQDEALVSELVGAVTEQHLWDSLLSIVRQMSDEGRRTMVAQPVFHGSLTLREIVRCAVEQGLWLDLVPLVEALPADALPTLEAVIDEADKPLAQGLLGAVTDSTDAAELFAQLPLPVQQAVRRAAERLGMQAELDALVSP